jgi:putative transposase
MPSYARKHQLQNSLVYHVYNRSQRGEYIFQQKQDFDHFITLARRMKTQFEMHIYHWVIMSNHYHFCVELEDPHDISASIAGLQRAYTHYYNATRGVSGYLWQGRFKSQAIEAENHLVACGRYIERNPVRAAMVPRAYDWDYSSAGYYCLGKEDGLTDESCLFLPFGDTMHDRQRAYGRYLCDRDEDEEQIFRDFVSAAGSLAFKRRLIKMGGHDVPRRRGRPRGN